MNRDEHILLLRSFDEELSEVERAQLDSLLASDNELQDAHDEEVTFRSLVSDTRVTSFGPSFVAEVVDATKSDIATPPAGPLRLVSVAQQYRAVAAVVALVALVGVITLLRSTGNSNHLIAAPLGETLEHQLPDGSVVVLNSGSTLTYGADFSNSRRVTLAGEALFDVVHTDATFSVATSEATLTVYGTSFNVRAWSDLENRTVVTLHSGSLGVEDRASGESIMLSPGERVTVGQAAASMPTSADSSAIDTQPTWVRGGLSFQSEPLGFVAAELMRRFDVEVRVRDARLASRRVTYLDGDPGSIEAVLSAICYALGAEYRLINGGYEVLPANS